ncbi:GTP-binding protein [Vibrio maritimus]|uniref:GTP-binding protein n=1 Tax=Vibrio maritimus TaxID=990268 RepID=UPI004068E70C
MSTPATSKAVPVTLVIGALGAGKTTFLQQLLEAKPEQQSWAVLVNDIGEAQVDGRVLSPLANGFQAIEGNCLCCSGKVESVSAIEALMEDVAGPFDRLVIEASGVSDPLNLIGLLGDKHFIGRLKLERIVTVINTQTPIIEALKDNTTSRAIACADIIALSHSDIAEPNELSGWTNAMQQLSPQKAMVCKTSELTLDSLALSTSQHWTKSVSIGGEFGLSIPKPEVNKAHLKRTGRMELFNPHWSRIDQYYEHMTTALWRFAPESEFSYSELTKLFENNEFQRVKGILKTDQGWCFINSTSNVQSFNLIPSEQSAGWTESRLEGIAEGDVDWADVEVLLTKALQRTNAAA